MQIFTNIKVKVDTLNFYCNLKNYWFTAAFNTVPAI